MSATETAPDDAGFPFATVIWRTTVFVFSGASAAYPPTPAPAPSAVVPTTTATIAALLIHAIRASLPKRKMRERSKQLTEGLISRSSYRPLSQLLALNWKAASA